MTTTKKPIWFTIASIAWIVLGLACLPLALFSSIFFFDSPQSQGSPLPWIMVGLVLCFPVLSIIFGGLGLLMRSRTQAMAISFLLAPVLVLGAVVVVIAASSLVSMPGSNPGLVGVSSPKTKISSCTLAAADRSVFNITGCGSIAVGEVARGQIANNGDANLWQFSADPSRPVTIQLQNDKEACLRLEVLDNSGKVLNSFMKENDPRTCIPGMLVTNLYSFTPKAAGVYILEVTIPQAPGKYSLTIQ